MMIAAGQKAIQDDCSTNMIGIDRKREEFFLSSLKRLQRASGDKFKTLHQQCEIEQNAYDEKYPKIIMTTQDKKFEGITEHDISKELLPSDYASCVPLHVLGDGNCLYRAASVLCTGLEAYHLELRARTCCELVLHQDYYLTPDKLDALIWTDEEQCKSHKQLGKNTIVASSPNYEKGVQTNCNTVLAKTVFELDCLDTSNIGNYSNMWHIHALSSVLKSILHCVYPEVNLRTRNAFHKVIIPREHCSSLLSHDLIIMWTRAAKADSKSTLWKPNHFVPCIRYPPHPSHDLLNTQGAIDLKQPDSVHDSQYSCTEFPENCTTILRSKDQEGTSMNKIILIKMPLHNKKSLALLPPGQSNITKFTCGLLQKMNVITEVKKPKAVTECLKMVHTPINPKVDAPSVYSLALMTSLKSLHSKTKQNTVNPSSKITFAKVVDEEAKSSDNHELCDTSADNSTEFNNVTSYEPMLPCKLTDSTNNNSEGLLLDVAITGSASNYASTSTPFAQSISLDCCDLNEQKKALIIEEESDSKIECTNYSEMYSDDDSVLQLSAIGSNDFNDHGVSIICDSSPTSTSTSSDSDSLHGPEDADSQLNSTIEQEVQTEQIESKLLPFPLLLQSWYMKQGRLLCSNARRKDCHQNMPITEVGEIMVLRRSTLTGSIEESIINLKRAVDDLLSKKQFRKADHIKKLMVIRTYIIEHGPIVSTQDIARVYKRNTGKEDKQVRITSTGLYDIISKYFNVIQIYFCGKAYVVADATKSLELCLSQIVSAVNKSHIANEVVKDRIGRIYEHSLDYIDTPRDKQVLKGIMSILTNITFTSNLGGKKSRSSVRTAFNMLQVQLDKFDDIKKTSQIVRSDLTCIQQHLLTKRIIALRKHKEIKIIAQGRGRHMKCEEMPELPQVLEYAFGDYDTHVCSGGGLESHPRLTDGTLYRTADSRTTMKDARKLLLSFAPLGFTISLSSCYNYTMNYRAGTAQATQHHDGRGVNANISLHMPPRTAVQEIVINLHWTTSNVNLIIDSTSLKKDSAVAISKDAKAIVCGDISPVQRPGRCWKKRTLPDHTWDQSRVNAVTPMTFLFLETSVTRKETVFNEVHTDNLVYITRSGQAVSLLYLSFYEPDTTFKCLNEFLYLLTLPSLDVLFRNPSTGKLKEEIVFVVDNGPSEQPCSSMVQMLLVRLLKFLGLHKIIQVSFAEYHSKRNFVERVHASENLALSRHGPFCSSAMHPSAVPGMSEHRDNMEAMASEIEKCLNGCTFSGRNMQCFRGICPDQFVFNDEEQLKTFLDLSEERKLLAPPSIEQYKPVTNSLFQCLVMTWHLDEMYSGSYVEDYKLLTNKHSSKRTAHLDKYTVCVVAPDENENTTLSTNIQPLPDYLRWLRTGELHYLPLLEREELDHGVWNEVPGMFLPSKNLDLILKLIEEPPDDIILIISLLAWVTPKEVKDYIHKKKSELEKLLDNDQQRETWKEHTLYQLNNKANLEDMCRKNHIPIPSGKIPKHNLVKLIVQNRGEEIPPTAILYAGDIEHIPKTTTALSKLSVAHLRAILHFHNCNATGMKDELVILVYLLRHGRRSAMFEREERQLSDFIKIVYDLISCQRILNITNHTYSKRTHLSVSSSGKVPHPSHITSAEDLLKMFDPLLEFISIIKHTSVNDLFLKPCDIKTESFDKDELKTQISQTGSRIKVKWTKDEVADSGWKPGWYIAEVQSYDEDEDVITVVFPCEPGCIYSIALSPAISENTIKLVRAAL